MLEQTTLLSRSIKNPKLHQFYNDPPSILSYIAFLVTSILIAVLCELNRHPWNQNILLQNISSAAFCVLAACLYVVYMMISTFLKLVLTYAGSFYHVPITAYDEDHDSDSEQSSENTQNRYRIPRAIIISSMYLGGSGAYLAILPLCMWDFTMSASFVLSLVVISCVDAKRTPNEFKPNVDTVAAIRNLRLLRFFYHLFAIVSVVLIIWIDTKEEIIYYMIPMLNAPSIQIFLANQTAVSPPTFVLEGQTGLAFKWPLIILSASSPIFLRAGGGGIGRFFYSLPPSQTLETGLPVSTILAILILCWHSPTEHILREIEHMINYKTAIPMLILCPLLISASLAFLLYSFKRRSAGIISVVLLIVLCVRQQIATIRHEKTTLDCIAISSVAQTFGGLLMYLLYKRYVFVANDRHKQAKDEIILLEVELENLPENDDFSSPKE